MSDEQQAWLIEHILANWNEWDGEAGQTEQIEQDETAYWDVMREFLQRAFDRAKEA